MTPEQVEAERNGLVKTQSERPTWPIDGDEAKYLASHDRAGRAVDPEQKPDPAASSVGQRREPRPWSTLSNFNTLIGRKIIAKDGPIGHVKAALFDDRQWVIRYLVVDTGSWLAEREVLISPHSVEVPLDLVDGIRVSLSREQIERSPDIDTHRPVSRQHERDYLDYYAYPDYWSGVNLWGIGAYPLGPPYRPTTEDLADTEAMRSQEARPDEVHLRTTEAVTGYDIAASDGAIGHIEDFVFEERSWAIRYVAVNTRNWWPGGARVLLATRWFEQFDWASRTAEVRLTRAQIKGSPPYESGMTIDRDYEDRLHQAYEMDGYWTDRLVRDPGDLLRRS